MDATDTLDHDDILIQARAIKPGTWIEKILAHARKALCGVGVADFKDLKEKVISDLPNLTGAATYPNWVMKVTKLINSVKDGKQLNHRPHPCVKLLGG